MTLRLMFATLTEMLAQFRVLVLVPLLACCGRDAEPTATSRPTVSTPALTGPKAQKIANAPKSAQTAIIFPTNDGDRKVTVEVVSNYATIHRGLMYREHLPPDHGMLFVFGTDQVRSFWMKNTLIPLDMLFVRSDFTVAGIERNTKPLDLTSRSVGIPTRYVLELNGGWTEKYGIEAGTQLRIENLPEFEKLPE